ncbi:PQQ-dependent sugar dehydrogenase [Flavobacterium pallidum]|uniref:Cadherin n=1 Tax=Flavobacterium pallidum TaxID=2172098 RepID=A0A2S1SFY0_9FLAO|nr:PQQ-dependent sugar dehydrogenase [Flavobacterium pallidum]AWI25316.1 cadherin [Flavobacterium pallidum]
MKYLYFLITLFSLSGFSQTIGIQSFATGFSSIVEIVNAGDDRLFVVQQTGVIKILNANQVTNPSAFLNISALISTGGERGLLGLAFHPNYATNGYFYVNYTNTAGNTVIARYSVNTSNPNLANTASATILLTISQPFANHNGGTLRFGPDGYLYIGMGDGGGQDDPGNRAQNKDLLLGKILRIDVDNGAPYAIPPTNPYAAADGADEIWATGMRNPWKFSFDTVDGNLWIGDVGQFNVEEINKVPVGDGGYNFGWRCYEGNDAHITEGCEPQNTMTFPFVTYSSADGSGNCSITGGYVYRGSAYPNFVGKYFFADYCSDKIGMVADNGTISYSGVLTGGSFTTFGVNAANDLFVGSQGNGVIYKVVDTSLGVDDVSKNTFSVYPNPASGSFSIHSENARFPLQLTVFDISGKKLLEKTIGSGNENINISGFSTGLYLVNTKDDMGMQSVSRLVIQ